MIQISNEDLGTLVICAIRYSYSRHTYMPELVTSIIFQHISEFSDKDVFVIDKELKKPGVFYNSPDISTLNKLEDAICQELKRRKELHG